MPERMIRPGILSSEPVNRLPWAEEVFYRRLMSIVDDYGRFDGRNSVLRANLYPLKLDHVSDSDIGKWKAVCANAGLVRVYFVDEKEYIELLKFNQRLRGKPKWPDPIGGDSPQSAASCGIPPPSSHTETHTETQAAGGRAGDAPNGDPLDAQVRHFFEHHPILIYNAKDATKLRRVVEAKGWTYVENFIQKAISERAPAVAYLMGCWERDVMAEQAAKSNGGTPSKLKDRPVVRVNKG